MRFKQYLKLQEDEADDKKLSDIIALRIELKDAKSGEEKERLEAQIKKLIATDVSDDDLDDTKDKIDKEKKNSKVDKEKKDTDSKDAIDKEKSKSTKDSDSEDNKDTHKKKKNTFPPKKKK